MKADAVSYHLLEIAIFVGLFRARGNICGSFVARTYSFFKDKSYINGRISIKSGWLKNLALTLCFGYHVDHGITTFQ